MHSRAYLKTPYLDDEWWDAVSACVDEGNKTGFYPWIYDEYAWPSGTAGSTFDYGYQKPSKTLASGRKNMSKGLVLRKFSSALEFKKYVNTNANQTLLCLFCKEGTSFCPVSDIDTTSGEILAFYVNVNTRFVDYLNKETIREFISYTHEEYKKRYGEHFGKRIPGVFFDEIFMQRFAPWTDNFPEEFKTRRGYDIMPLLYALAVEGTEKEKEIRIDFYKTVAELYEETFFGQIGSWCQENGLQLTGHTEEDLLVHPDRQGNFFNTMRHLQIPGADCHDYRYRFPRKITYREPKLAVSVSRAYGRERAMSEAFGGAGWSCTLQEFKRGVNTAGAMGISMFTLHGFYTDIHSQGSQSDWSGNFFFQNPYWRYFKHFSDYISRVCYINSQGLPVVDVGLYYPLDEMRVETHITGTTAKGEAINKAFNTVLECLIENQIDTDIIDSENILKAEIEDGKLCIGKEKFSVIVIPDIARLEVELSKKLEEFSLAGGKILYYSTQKDSVNNFVVPSTIHKAVSEVITKDVVVIGDNNDLFVNHRKIDDKDFYFVSNSTPKARELTILLREKGRAQKLSPESGEICEVCHSVTEDGTIVKLSLSEDEGVWIVLDSLDGSEEIKHEKLLEEMIVSGKWDFLPVPSSLDGEEQIKQECTELKIPLATLSSNLHRDSQLIRVQNKEGQLGYIGRHLSLWSANWITRRVRWADNCPSDQMYFRRNFLLDKKPDSARICLAAINEWSLYINGQEVSSSKEGFTPTTLDIMSYLKAGKNNICVSVHNETPAPEGSLLQREELISELLTSLIAELEMTFGEEKQVIFTNEEWDVCEAVDENWTSLDFEPYSFYFDASRVDSAPPLEPTKWSKAWERGRPPLKPFGDLPLFDEMLQYPQRVCYGIELPCGTQAVKYPYVLGENIEISIDGMPANFENGVYKITPSKNTRYMQISLLANNSNDGLQEGVSVELVPVKGALCDWRLHGLKWYSGFATYKNNFNLYEKSGRYILDLGQTCHQAEVWINNKKAGERVWEPYRLDITEFLKVGNNEIVIVVSNSAGVEHQFMLLDEGGAMGWNRYWNYDNILREGEKLVSGLIGQVKIFRYTND